MDELEQMRKKIARWRSLSLFIADEKLLQTINELVVELEAEIALRGRSKKGI
jgi:hypothetical protein